MCCRCSGRVIGHILEELLHVNNSWASCAQLGALLCTYELPEPVGRVGCGVVGGCGDADRGCAVCGLCCVGGAWVFLLLQQHGPHPVDETDVLHKGGQHTSVAGMPVCKALA